VADSITLLPYLLEAWDLGVKNYVDIGSGGGFPALPLAVAGVRLRMLLIERSERKAEFLRLMVQRLSLVHASVVVCSYPHCEMPTGTTVFTARATEEPNAIDTAILKRLGIGDVYLAQRQLQLGTRERIQRPVEDEFDRLGLRRSRLFLVGDPISIGRFHVELVRDHPPNL
jgi:16S rRNA G527 N7-methylase RsmG